MQLTIEEALAEGGRRAEEGMGRAVRASLPEGIAGLDALIARRAATGERFSANDLRGEIPEGVRPGAVGGRFQAAVKAGLIRGVGYTPSTDPRTHRHPIRVWEGVARS